MYLRTGGAEIVFGIKEAGAETGSEAQHLLQAGEGEAGAEARLRHPTVDAGQHFTALTQKYLCLRSPRQEM